MQTHVLAAADGRKYAIQVDGLSKRFRLYKSPVGRIADFIAPKPGRYEDVTALDDVSFDVKRGECFAIVGSNGSGKSTLLKLITGTLVPTAGQITVDGRVLALLELGGGINPELSGRQNVEVSAALLGFPDGYAKSKMTQIEEFAELGDFFDRPMRTYSSGMYVRLAFSIYLFMEPDIFIVDEALSVGDVFFQQKCYRALRAIMEKGATVLFVSHDTGAVQKLCNRAMLLDRGRVQFIGLPDETVNRYHTRLGERSAAQRDRIANGLETKPNTPLTVQGRASKVLAHNLLAGGPTSTPPGNLVLLGVRVEGHDGHSQLVHHMGDVLIIEALIEAQASVPRPDLTLAVFDRFGMLMFRTSLARQAQALPEMTAGQRRLVRFSLGCALDLGHYTFTVTPRDDEAAPTMDSTTSQMLGPLIVTTDRATAPYYGQIGLPSALVSAEPQR